MAVQLLPCDHRDRFQLVKSDRAAPLVAVGWVVVAETDGEFPGKVVLYYPCQCHVEPRRAESPAPTSARRGEDD